jgi:hypothetical protein
MCQVFAEPAGQLGLLVQHQTQLEQTKRLACGSQVGGYQCRVPARYHSSQVSSASAATIGTNTADTRSAKAWMGALLQVGK